MPTETATPVAADVAAKASKELAAAIRKARKTYSDRVTPVVTTVRVERDKAIADAYHRFGEQTGTMA
jgi:ribosome-binding factor A